MCLHLADGWLAAVGAAKSSASSGPSVWDILSALLGAGVLAFLSWIIDLFRKRSRFGAKAFIDSFGTVRVRLVKRGKGKGYVEAMKVVVVKLRLYRWASKVTGTEVNRIEVAELTMPTEPLKSDQPFQTYKILPEMLPLPPPLNPFARWKERKWKRRELRVELTVSTSDRSRFIRCRYKKGRIAINTPRSDEPATSPDEPATS